MKYVMTMLMGAVFVLGCTSCGTGNDNSDDQEHYGPDSADGDQEHYGPDSVEEHYGPDS